MAAKMGVHEGVIRPSLVQELEQFRAPDGRVSSYYLNLAGRREGQTARPRSKGGHDQGAERSS